MAEKNIGLYFWGMSKRRIIPFSYGTFFITITCNQWLPLIERVEGYDIVYRWFQYLRNKNHYINAYVIMPNHMHVLLSFTKTRQRINTIIGNGKRFMAYEIIQRLENGHETQLLDRLSVGTQTANLANRKIHAVWETSFDWKHCFQVSFANQKLLYAHNNPCRGKWALCHGPIDYPHSSAKFYATGEPGLSEVKHILEMQDVVLG